MKAGDLDHPDVLAALNNSIRTLRQGMDMHCCLVRAILEKGSARLDGCQRARCPQRSREAVLKDALKEAITVIEETRRAFKSKQLEALRKRLTEVLIETH